MALTYGQTGGGADAPFWQNDPVVDEEDDATRRARLLAQAKPVGPPVLPAASPDAELRAPLDQLAQANRTGSNPNWGGGNYSTTTPPGAGPPLRPGEQPFQGRPGTGGGRAGPAAPATPPSTVTVPQQTTPGPKNPVSDPLQPRSDAPNAGPLPPGSKLSPATQTVIDQKKAEALLDIDRKRIERGFEAQSNFGRQGAQLQVMDALLNDQNFTSGPDSAWTLRARQILASAVPGLFSKDELASQSAQAAFVAVSNALATSMRDIGSGAMSDKDLGIFLASVPNLGNDPTTNREILRNMRDTIKHLEKVQAAQYEYWKNNGQSLEGWEKHVAGTPELKWMYRYYDRTSKDGEAQFRKLPRGARVRKTNDDDSDYYVKVGGVGDDF